MHHSNDDDLVQLREIGGKGIDCTSVATNFEQDQPSQLLQPNQTGSVTSSNNEIEKDGYIYFLACSVMVHTSGYKKCYACI